MDAFKTKLALWNSPLQEEDVEMFPLFYDFLNATEVNKGVLFNIIKQHLRALFKNINNYFPENEHSRKGNFWINNSFLEDIP